MREKKWTAFRGETSAFEYPGKALLEHWPSLHAGDCEPYPTERSLAARQKDGDSPAAATADAVADAWRAFHRGDFHRAFELGKQQGLAGFAVQVKAAGVYASYLERSETHAQALLLEASQLAEQAATRLPKDCNAHYLYAFALGRYSQRISIAEALLRGLAGKVEKALEQTLKLQSRHAEAHIALGLYHAEITARLGSFAAGLSYGASGKKAVEHFKKALKLTPRSAIAHLEYAHGLELLDRDEHAEQIDELRAAAAKCEPLDASQWMDRERARKAAS